MIKHIFAKIKSIVNFGKFTQQSGMVFEVKYSYNGVGGNENEYRYMGK